MNEQDIEQQVLGYLMFHEAKTAFQYLPSIKDEYFTSGQNKDILWCVRELISRGDNPSIMKVGELMKSKKGANTKIFISLSSMTTKAPAYPHLMDGLVSALVNNFNKRTVGNFLQLQNKRYSEGTLSLDTFIASYKKLEDSIDYGSEKERTILEVWDEVLELHDKAKNGESAGIGLGHAAIADLVELEPVDVMVIAGRPAMGKTAFGMTTVRNLCIQNELKVAFFVIEMSDVQLVRRLQSNLTAVSSSKIRKGTLSDDDRHKIDGWRSNNNLSNLHIFTGDHTVEDITLKCIKLKNSVGLDLIIIDYIQKVTSSLPNSASETEKVKQVSDDLKRITQRLKVPQVQFAQLKRNESREGNRPGLPDLKYTTAIEENATIVAFLHRPEYYGQKEMEPGRSSENICEFIIAKNREDSTEIREFIFHKWTGQFTSNMAGGENKTEKQTDLPF
jgi:replicative DNA helicase